MCSAKRDNTDIVIQSNDIILDIEGTTTSITFVKDVLFPYVRKNLEAYVNENWNSEGFQDIVNGLRIQANQDKENKLDGVIEIPKDGEKDTLAKAVIENVLWQMDLDSKAKSLKDLQGLIMEVGYKKGELKGHIYEDVEPNMKSWIDLGKSVYIYSSGSVHAQKLLYGHSAKGDLLPYIKGHFDTTVGKKGDAESYKKIIEQISSTPSETVFFTDVPTEARAAKEVGLLAILLSREGNAPLTDEDRTEFQVITSFSEIHFENNSKKRKVCTDNDNKPVESCEVSVKFLKEPSNPTLTQQKDDMEVDESYTEEKDCNVENNDGGVKKDELENKTEQNPSAENGIVELQTKDDEHIKEDNLENKTQQNPSIENVIVELKTTNETDEVKTSDKEREVIESQITKDLNSGDALEEEIESDKLKTQTEGEPEKNGVKPGESSPLTENDHKELDPITNKNESVVLGEKTTSEPTTIDESHPCEDERLLEVNPDKKESSDNTASEKSQNTEEVAQDQKNDEKSQVAEENGDIIHNSAATSKGENDTSLQNKSDIETNEKKDCAVEKDKEIQNLENKTTENIHSKQDTVNGMMNPHPNENDKVEETSTSADDTLESNKVSTNLNNSASVTMTNSSDMEVDEKPCPKGSANSDDILSSSTIDDKDTHESNQVPISVNKPISITKTNSSDMEVDEKLYPKESENSVDNLSNSTTDEKNMPESNQNLTNINNSVSLTVANSSDMEVDEKPCLNESANSKDTLQKNSTLDEKNKPESNQDSANKTNSVSLSVNSSSDMEVDEKPCSKESPNSDILSKKTSPVSVPSKDISESEDVETELMKESTTKSEPLDSVLTADHKTDTKIPESFPQQNEPETTDNGSSDDVKSDQNNPEVSSKPNAQEPAIQVKEHDVLDSNLETTEDKSSLESVNKHQEDEKSTSEQAPTEIMDSINIQNSKENGKTDSEDKSADESCTESKEESKLDNTVSASSDLELKSEIQNQSSDTESSQKISANQCDDEAEILQRSENADQKTTKETNCLKSKATILDSDVKNGINEDESNHVNEKEIVKIFVWKSE